MIISFTGAQSTGKSTLLDRIKLNERFRKFNVVPEITRTLKSKYNLKINEDGNDITQLAILNGHLDNFLKYKNKDVILDRCILDGLIYTCYLYNTKKVSGEVASYAEFLTKKLIDHVDVLFYTEPDIPLKDDGERSSNEEFRNIVIQLFEEAINHFDLNVIRLKGTVEERLDIIYNNFDNYGK